MSRCLVTGARGFIGSALARRLQLLGHEVIGTSREQSCNQPSDSTWVTIDIASAPTQKLDSLVSSMDVVFHVAAKVEVTGRGREFYSANVYQTKVLLDACERQGVSHFIFTSSPSVIADGNALRGIDERYPYPLRFKGEYQRTKALAEQLVRFRGESGALKTLVLRPHLVFGPNDTSLIKGIVDKARTGQLVQVGPGNNIVDFTYIDDCIDAHVQAFEALKTNPLLSGNVYFISQGNPYSFWRWVGQILKIHDLPPLEKKIPSFAASVYGALGSISELIGMVPRVNSFLIDELLTDHYFSIDAAKKDLGYFPRKTMSDRLLEYQDWYSAQTP